MAAKVEIFSELDAVAANAAGGLDRATQPCLFDRLDWFRLLARHCPPDGALEVVDVQDAGGRAWLFLARYGSTVRGYANWYNLRFDAARQGDAHAAVVGVAAALKDKTAKAELYPLDEGSPLPAAFRDAGWIVALESASTSWTMSTEGMDFAAYWAGRSGRLRNTFKRKAKAAGLEIEIHRAFDAEAWQAYEAVYARSWKPQEGSWPFLRALADQEGAAATLRLGVARKDGRPIAAQLWLVENEIATIHKLAYAEDAKDLSPGTILSHAMFRDAIDVDRVRLIDFGTGDDGYKAEWMEERRPLYRMTAWNPRSVRGLAGAAHAALGNLVRRRRRL